jgi:hypothetical protein
LSASNYQGRACTLNNIANLARSPYLALHEAARRGCRIDSQRIQSHDWPDSAFRGERHISNPLRALIDNCLYWRGQTRQHLQNIGHELIEGADRQHVGFDASTSCPLNEATHALQRRRASMVKPEQPVGIASAIVDAFFESIHNGIIPAAVADDHEAKAPAGLN